MELKALREPVVSGWVGGVVGRKKSSTTQSTAEQRQSNKKE